MYTAKFGVAFDLRPVELTILALIDDKPEVSAKAMAQALAVSAPNITVSIDKRAGRGLVKPERSETDRRTQHSHATVEGSWLARRSAELLQAGEQNALKALREGERGILAELLRSISAASSRRRAMTHRSTGRRAADATSANAGALGQRQVRGAIGADGVRHTVLAQHAAARCSTSRGLRRGIVRQTGSVR